MKIFYDHQVFSLQNAGGAARYYFELIKHLQLQLDRRIVVALGLNHSVYSFPDLRSENTFVFSRRTNLSPGVLRYSLNEALVSASAISHGKFDIYHPTLYRAMPFVNRRRIVVTHHDCSHERFPEMFRNTRKVIQAKRKLYAEADAIISVSEFSRQELISYYDLDPGKIFTVYHGFEPFALDSSKSDQGSRPIRPYLLFVGFRRTYKNFDFLLESYAESKLLNHYDLVTVGGGEFSSDELKEIKRLGLDGKVQNLQDVSEVHLAGLYRKAALFVYPSLSEGFGFPPLEAMSQGCPVLASQSSCIPEICGDAAFYFDPTDRSDCIRNLEHALASDASRSIMRERGFQQVKKYQWDETANATYEVYRGVCQA
jgi:glycosyltransferase involved in cell wall biosynthesis